MLIGYGYSLVIAFLLGWAFIALLGLDPKVNLSVGSAGLLTLGVFLPGLFFASLGVLTSQLALTRGRALAYGLVPLLVLFCLRGAANSITDWNDLKRYTPFGWTDLLNPVLGADSVWILPTVIFAVTAIPLALYFARTRDLGGSILPQSDHARSRFYLLNSDLGLTIRQSIPSFIWWTLGTLAYTGLLASIAKVGADVLSSSPAFVKVMGKLGGSYDDLVVAFLGFGGLFTALILLVMVAVIMGNIRNQEAKGYLDNVLVQPIRRTMWLARRVGVLTLMVAIISLLSGDMIWQIASAQGVSLDLGIMLQNAISLTGTIFLLVGIGTFFYGVLPRIASPVMFAVIVWAFIVDILKSFFSLGDFIDKTSLLHYVSFAPTKAPDWSTFAWLVVIGVITAGMGILAFAKRDVTPE
ncbi:MAG: hypothetical protein JWO07_370 [Candidatus Saccharibacteria bacterium]|nr:hypothetical protein [Candidatus Saccharibacteria bacterium]